MPAMKKTVGVMTKAGVRGSQAPPSVLQPPQAGRSLRRPTQHNEVKSRSFAEVTPKSKAQTKSLQVTATSITTKARSPGTLSSGRATAPIRREMPKEPISQGQAHRVGPVPRDQWLQGPKNLRPPEVARSRLKVCPAHPTLERGGVRSRRKTSSFSQGPPTLDPSPSNSCPAIDLPSEPSNSNPPTSNSCTAEDLPCDLLTSNPLPTDPDPAKNMSSDSLTSASPPSNPLPFKHLAFYPLTSSSFSLYHVSADNSNPGSLSVCGEGNHSPPVVWTPQFQGLGQGRELGSKQQLTACPEWSRNLRDQGGVEDSVGSHSGEASTPQAEKHRATQVGECGTMEAGDCRTVQGEDCGTAQAEERRAARAGKPETAQAGECGETQTESGSAAQARECGEAQTESCSAAQAGECGAAQTESCSAAQAGECGEAQTESCSAAQARECEAAQIESCSVAQAGECGEAQTESCSAAQAGECGEAQTESCSAAQAGECGEAQTESCSTAQAGEFETALADGSSTVQYRDRGTVATRDCGSLQTVECRTVQASKLFGISETSTDGERSSTGRSKHAECDHGECPHTESSAMGAASPEPGSQPLEHSYSQVDCGGHGGNGGKEQQVKELEETVFELRDQLEQHQAVRLHNERTIEQLECKVKSLENQNLELGKQLKMSNRKMKEEEEWRYFQADLQTAVVVANDMKCEAQEEMRELRKELQEERRKTKQLHRELAAIRALRSNPSLQ
ncbi:uncharacterized protein specc1 isoform X2 [Hypanus sabinus]|uniref:uncharacterized protein specc1 isoform X2 n=1 Tax=Hypanus sabinus TaxID=79690 RepID=UPI0028C3A412|nr:uncharacterized protein specc1 isoform X2 [Hypanus sabinus]